MQDFNSLRDWWGLITTGKVIRSFKIEIDVTILNEIFSWAQIINSEDMFLLYMQGYLQDFKVWVLDLLIIQLILLF